MKKLIATTLAITVPLTSGAFTVSLNPNHLHIGEFKGKSAGHEEITRQSLLIALDAVRRSVKYPLSPLEDEVLRQGLENERWGTLGYAVPNPVIRGNHSNDIPGTPNYSIVPEYLNHIPFLLKSTAVTTNKTTKYLKPENLRVRSFWMWYNLESEFANLKTLSKSARKAREEEVKRNMGGNWDYNYEFQSAHSLRDTVMEKDGKTFRALTSSRATCERTRSYIHNLAILAVKNLNKASSLLAESDATRNSAKSKHLRSSAKDYTYQAFFQIGQASHSLQDSFSAAHTVREGENYDIKDICVYGDSYKKMLNSNAGKTCYHFEYVPAEPGIRNLAKKGVEGVVSYREGDMHDSIWIRGEEDAPKKFPNYVQTLERWGHKKGAKGQVVEHKEEVNLTSISNTFIEEVSAKWANMKDEARMARTATAKYVYVILEYLSDVRNGYIEDDQNYSLLSNRLNAQFFDGSPQRLQNPVWIADSGYVDKRPNIVHVAPIKDIMKDGVFRCGQLSNEPIVPGK